jgi:restriction endonuclease Mrr
MQQILVASSPYSLIKEAEGLITTVGTANTALVNSRRTEAVQRIDGLLVKLTAEVDAATGDPGLRAGFLEPLETLKGRVQMVESLAHITQAESEALKEYDAASVRIEEFVKKLTESLPKEGADSQPKPALKKKRVVQPSKLVTTAYLESKSEVDGFLNTLRAELEEAIASGERIEIR